MNSNSETRFDKEEDMISRALMITVIIISLPVVSILQLSPKVMAQVSTYEGAKVLVDDIIEALKNNDTNRAQIHLNILNQQLPTFVNSSSLESVKVLLDDVSLALKNNDVNNALIHLNLVKQEFANTTGNAPLTSARNVNISANSSVSSNLKLIKLSTYKNPTYGITSVHYPSDWRIDETNTQPNDRSASDIVLFYPTEIKNYLPGQPPVLVRISIYSPDDPQVVSNLTSAVYNADSMFWRTVSNYNTLSYNTTSKLAGYPAYSLEYTGESAYDKSNFRGLELGTIISGKVLTMSYLADLPSFSTFFPTALKIINSLRINKSAFEQGTSPQGNMQDDSNNAGGSQVPSSVSPPPSKNHRHHSQVQMRRTLQHRLESLTKIQAVEQTIVVYVQHSNLYLSNHVVHLLTVMDL